MKLKLLTLSKSFDVSSNVFDPDTSMSAHFAEDPHVLSTHTDFFTKYVCCRHVSVEAPGVITATQWSQSSPDVKEEWIAFTWCCQCTIGRMFWSWPGLRSACPGPPLPLCPSAIGQYAWETCTSSWRLRQPIPQLLQIVVDFSRPIAHTSLAPAECEHKTNLYVLKNVKLYKLIVISKYLSW